MKLPKKATGKIDTIEEIRIGGTKQYISLRSGNCTNPVILFLHGGPGSAQISLSRKSQKELERFFIVVNWDQRGAGRSFSRHVHEEDMTIERLCKDTEELAEALLKRFGQKKIFLVGHSWGSILGAKLAARRPDIIHTYIGIGQVVNMKRGEELSYRFTLNEAKRLGNKKALKQLQKIGSPPYEKLRIAGVQRKWLSKFHGSIFQGTLFSTIIKNISLRDTRLIDNYKIPRGAIFSMTSLETKIMEIDFLKELLEFDVPVIFCCGRKDYNTPFELVVEYMEKIRALEKQIVWFERSAHAPNFEEPGKFCNLCISLLKTN